MKKGLTRITLAAGIMALCLIVIGSAMPIQSCSPQQAADIMLQPTRDEINTIKADLVAGDITEEQAILRMESVKFQLELKTIILEAIRDSTIMSYNQKLEALFAVFPWNVR